MKVIHCINVVYELSPMTAFDLKLFRVFDEIHRSRSVSRAAHTVALPERIGQR